MSHPFAYHRALSASDAAARLAEAGTVPLGGGTDLLVQIEEGIARPGAVVDLRTIPGSAEIREVDGGGLRIGAAARLHEIARHPLVRGRWPALAQACDVVGTTALRHMGTLGGNLCQRPRCWYFRRNIACLKNGGDACPAREGENQYHAILGGGPCWIVHPSDPAVALTALEAKVEIVGPGGERTLDITELYALPAERLDQETVLERGEYVAALTLDAGSAGGTQSYRKLMQRDSWDFALASIAAVKRQNGDVRLVFGGVAPKPWRVGSSVEEDVASGGLDEDTIATLADRALYDAEPLALNGYKVELAASLLRDAMRELGGG